MRISIIITVIVALLAVGAVIVLGQNLLQPDLPLLTEAGFSPEAITPNADGNDDITIFSYSLSRNAQVSLLLESQDGEQYYFRKDETRIPGDYSVQFSGVVDGYTLPGEQIEGEVLRRLMPDGDYTWRLQAVDTVTGETDELSGTLSIREANTPLPEIKNFTISPDVFTPNQDGIDDVTQISLYLTQPASLMVYLEVPGGGQIFIAEREEGRQPGEPGRHFFTYAPGGSNEGIEPPANGEYKVVALAQDAEGQRVQQTGTLTIQTGGDPEAEIAPQLVGLDVIFSPQPYDERYFTDTDVQGELVAPPNDPQDIGLTAITMPVGDMLVFKLTVENYGDVPIRTSGPPPGTVYQQDQVAATLGWLDESGAWRVGIDCDTATRDFPWRWAVGSSDDLVEQTDASGNTYYYLPAGASAVVWGAIRMTNLNEARNPQQCWAGLIHEDVAVSIRNSRVGAREIELVDLTSSSGG
jgi:hypothetical protein